MLLGMVAVGNWVPARYGARVHHALALAAQQEACTVYALYRNRQGRYK